MRAGRLFPDCGDTWRVAGRSHPEQRGEPGRVLPVHRAEHVLPQREHLRRVPVQAVRAQQHALQDRVQRVNGLLHVHRGAQPASPQLCNEANTIILGEKIQWSPAAVSRALKSR